jgi:hypothetical protein
LFSIHNNQDFESEEEEIVLYPPHRDFESEEQEIVFYPQHRHFESEEEDIFECNILYPQRRL